MTDPLVEQAIEHALELGELGFQVAAYVGDELVVDECVGIADPETGRPVDETTLFTVFSVTKAITVTVLHILNERRIGRLRRPGR